MIQKKIADFLFSTRLMAVLFIVFAVSMAVGTFIEDAYSTEFARIYVYDAKWFELIMVVFCINFFGNIGRYKLWRKEKLITLIFHLSFVLIIIGAGITRYISFEGLMPIENGQTVDSFYSGTTYLTAYLDGETEEGMMRKKKEFPVLLAEGANNHHTFKTDFKGQNVEFEITEFIKEAKRTVVEHPEGKRYLKIVNAGGGQRNDNFLEDGQVGSINNLLISFNKETDGAINIKEENGEYTINSPFPGTYMRMADRKEGVLVEDSVQTLQLASLYDLGGLQFVIPEEAITGKYEVVKADEGQSIMDAIVVKTRTDGEEEEHILMGNNQSVSNFTEFKLGDLDIHMRYGSKEYELPFSMHLVEFIAEKYPGTADNPNPSYSSFKSRVLLSDMSDKDTVEIYMNHVLDHKGYRFFQASFMPGEKGTVLSVNHDFWGTTITYIGYTLLYIGLVLILFVKGSRFTELAARLKRINKNKRKRRSKYLSVLAIILLTGSLTANAQVRKEDVPGYDQTEVPQDSLQTQEKTHAQEESSEIVGAQLSTDEIIDIIIENRVPQKQAEEFGKLVIQDFRGRMKPINTYSSELLRKLSRKDHYEDPATGETILTSDQFLISLTQNPMVWYTVPLIKVQLKDERLTDILDLEEDQKLVKFIQFFDENGDYKLGPYLEEAYRAKVKSRFQKDLVDADGQVNLLHNAMQGILLRIFPIPNHYDNKWLSFPEAVEQIDEFNSKDSLFVSNALPLYMGRLYEATRGTSEIEKGDYTQADELLEGIKAYQNKFGAQVMPSDQHIKAEVLYNKYDVFKNLFAYYMYVGLILFILVILEIFYPRRWMPYLINTGKIIVLLLFLAHTAGLAARWYISGHAPWSDAYESMI
ncbi:MAG TPA: cytochrome c biogenesis protein ResB, partial [Flavobacteriaceae bacterium]|nr:cytochrome c biogenesis protein ResB [Flavobacteriaceae bacterium]